MEHRQLNEIYSKLNEKAQEISKLLHCTFAYYNGHYRKNDAGYYEIDYFPIPVISLKGVCDIEIDLNRISVTAKLTKDKAISYNYEKLKRYNFEAYGVNNYLDDFYIDGSTVSDMIEKIKISKEENIFYSFYFLYEVPSDVVCDFVDFVKKEGFFY